MMTMEDVKLSFGIGILIGIVLTIVCVYGIVELSDFPETYDQWASIGEDLCKTKFNMTFNDWEDMNLICKEKDTIIPRGTIDYSHP